MALLVYTTAALLFYLLSLAVSRLYLSPLAKSKIPGPKLGALSKFYEAYYEIVQRGRFAFKLDDLHERYGKSGKPIGKDFCGLLADSRGVGRTNHPHHSRRSSYQGQLLLG